MATLCRCFSFATVNKIYTTEITSADLSSDNPLHQRLLVPYREAATRIRGSLLEVGCGEGRGIDLLLPAVNAYTAIDKIQSAIDDLQNRYPRGKFVAAHLPPLPFADASFDAIVTFQVIEHIEEDKFFLHELHRVLRPGGVLMLTTPNRRQSLSRNPWHVREYEAQELLKLAKTVFPQAEVKGISGSDRVMAYHEENRKSVQRIMRWDFLDLQYRLPAAILKIPYEWLNRWNRNKLYRGTSAARQITLDDYFVSDDASSALDLFLVATR